MQSAHARFRLGRRRGAVAVEMAVTLPVLFLFLFAAYEFGKLHFLRHACQGAAYEGARQGIVPGATANDVRRETRRMMNAIGARGAAIHVDPPVIRNDTERVAVTVQLPISANTLFGRMFSGQAVLFGHCELNREGQFD